MSRFPFRSFRGLFLGAAASAALLSGCQGSAEDATSAGAQTATVPAVETVLVGYRVHGATGAIAGSYTGATGADVAIPDSSAQPWESSVRIPISIMRGQQIKLAAHSASDPNATVTIEIWADGKMLVSQSGPSPSTFIQKH